MDAPKIPASTAKLFSKRRMRRQVVSPSAETQDVQSETVQKEVAKTPPDGKIEQVPAAMDSKPDVPTTPQPPRTFRRK